MNVIEMRICSRTKKQYQKEIFYDGKTFSPRPIRNKNRNIGTAQKAYIGFELAFQNAEISRRQRREYMQTIVKLFDVSNTTPSTLHNESNRRQSPFYGNFVSSLRTFLFFISNQDSPLFSSGFIKTRCIQI